MTTRFRDMLVLDKRTPTTVREELEPKIHRSWEDSSFKKFSRTRRITQELRLTPAGLLVPELIINPDHFRLGRVVSRIIKALVYVEEGYTENMRDSYAFGWSWEAFKRNRETKLWKRRVLDTLVDVEWRMVGGVLTYKTKAFVPPTEEAGKGPMGVWLLLFYDRIPFLGFSGCDNRPGVFCNKYQRVAPH